MMTRTTDAAAGLEPVLLARRRDLLRQVARLGEDLDWLQANVEPERLEEGQEQALAAVLERLDAHDRGELAAIEQALGRVRSGEYGRCAACGVDIPRARLEALPTAAFCRPCAAAREALERT